MTRSSVDIPLFAPVVLVSGAVLALAGCGSGKGDIGSASASPAARTPNPPAASPPPTSHHAADGTRLSSCEDATCEVEVTGPTRIPVNRKTGIAALKVRSISPEEISLTATAASTPTGYEFNSSCEGGASCTTSVDDDRADVTAHAGAKITLNGLVIRVTSLAGGSAILRLSPG